MMKDMATPRPFIQTARDVDIVRSWTGNQVADISGGIPITTGPANPFKICPIWIKLQYDAKYRNRLRS
jgi:hypothetical protein